MYIILSIIIIVILILFINYNNYNFNNIETLSKQPDVLTRYDIYRKDGNLQSLSPKLKIAFDNLKNNEPDISLETYNNLKLAEINKQLNKNMNQTMKKNKKINKQLTKNMNQTTEKNKKISWNPIITYKTIPNRFDK